MAAPHKPPGHSGRWDWLYVVACSFPMVVGSSLLVVHSLVGGMMGRLLVLGKVLGGSPPVEDSLTGDSLPVGSQPEHHRPPVLCSCSHRGRGEGPLMEVPGCFLLQMPLWTLLCHLEHVQKELNNGSGYNTYNIILMSLKQYNYSTNKCLIQVINVTKLLKVYNGKVLSNEVRILYLSRPDIICRIFMIFIS